MNVTPYLFFNGKCEEALDFYKKTLGAQVRFQMRYSEMPEKPDPSQVPPGNEDKICHVSFTIGDSELMASDGCPTQQTKFDGFSLSLTPKDPADAERVFAALAEGGQVNMPLGKTFFSPAFGMLADKFGVRWMIYVPQPM
ncbi:MAG TPA: VOC family protein [Stellaceae bacterium]|jgi:PhnB protein|nr:VOC family protein [Stellaceae bacterium]